ncbi:MAG: hypothetical protein ACRYE9_00705 [Janthinobacterium lividum]
MNNLLIKKLALVDIDSIALSFRKDIWYKPKETFEQYFQDQQEGSRETQVAYVNDIPVGYITLK